MRKKYYEEIWFAIVMLIFFFPVGIYLIWRYKHFTKEIRIGVCVGFLGLFIVSMIFGEPAPQEPENKDTINIIEPKPKVEEIKIEPAITKEYLQQESKNIEILEVEAWRGTGGKISIKGVSSFDNRYTIMGMQQSIMNICKVLKSSGLATEENVFFFEIIGPGEDKYGNEVDFQWAQAHVSGSEILKVNFENINSDEFVDIMDKFILHSSFKK